MNRQFFLESKDIKQAIAEFITKTYNLPEGTSFSIVISHCDGDRNEGTTYGATAIEKAPSC